MSPNELCRRCKTAEATVVSRKEFFCTACFRKFISLKQRKQMMSDQYFQDIFKVMYPDKKKTPEEAEKLNEKSRILVPLSFGSSSIVMLDVLNDTLTEQREIHRGRMGFRIDLLICYFKEDLEELKGRVEALMTAKLRDNKKSVKVHLVDIESFMESPDFVRVHLQDSTYTVRSASIPADEARSVKDLLSSCSNRSAREDLLNIIRTSIIKRFGVQGGYKAILWGHSMTRLADEIMSLVVKGRAPQIANTLNDSDPDIEFGAPLRNLHPMRDILLSEIDAYCFVSDLTRYLHNYIPQDTLLVNKTPDSLNAQPLRAKLTKNMTINELARQYFDGIEANYSNVISTVVRTGSKLDDPEDNLKAKERCGICNNRVFSDGAQWLRNITVTGSHPIENDEEDALYKMWDASEQGQVRGEYLKLTSDMQSAGRELSVCYGCILTLGEVKHKNLIWPSNQPNSVESIIKDFVMTDDSDSEHEGN
ncbi:LAQU0S05e02388g1_1 [Lachancea quebecensis]|uniref:Cytoplasmic tRNA 2-thiolation protein 2 n=1 Tax=Lachancea quebecensis TaxID=1654605 RepID=A0A0P1KRC7_9SACH|nr:LAQU0S05e02388g1_1 [Lachancea quebecensis]